MRDTQSSSMYFQLNMDKSSAAYALINYFKGMCGKFNNVQIVIAIIEWVEPPYGMYMTYYNKNVAGRKTQL